MEIRTCEEYVLDQLNQREDTIRDKELEVSALTDRMNKLIQIIMNHSKKDGNDIWFVESCMEDDELKWFKEVSFFYGNK